MGKVIQVIGPVVDVECPPGQLPNIYNALRVDQDEDKKAGKPAAFAYFNASAPPTISISSLVMAACRVLL